MAEHMNVGGQVYRKVWTTTTQRTFVLPEDHIIRRTWRDDEMGNAISRNADRVASTVNPTGRNLWNNTLRWEVNW
jgi:hypothetical protein